MSGPIVSVGAAVDPGSMSSYNKLLSAIGQAAVHVDIGIHDISGEDVVKYAGYNEFGAGNTPQRSFIRSTVDESRDKYQGRVKQRWEDILELKTTPFVALSLIGLEVQRDIQRKIRSNVPPPNAPSTIRRKGSEHTLIDTGLMVQEVRYAVKNIQERILDMGQPTIAKQTAARAARKSRRKPKP